RGGERPRTHAPGRDVGRPAAPSPRRGPGSDRAGHALGQGTSGPRGDLVGGRPQHSSSEAVGAARLPTDRRTAAVALQPGAGGCPPPPVLQQVDLWVMSRLSAVLGDLFGSITAPSSLVFACPPLVAVPPRS